MKRVSTKPSKTQKSFLSTEEVAVPQPKAVGERTAKSKDQGGYRDLGQHMTPPVIAEQMTGFLTRPVAEWRAFDPACGDGNLLLAVLDRMIKEGVPNPVERVAGVDIDEKMVRAARARIAERLGCDPSTVRVYHQDFMRTHRPTLFESPSFDPAEFNVVISNPPYGQNREYVFFELCDELFPRGCELVFLMPLAFVDRASGVRCVPLNGRPMGVTTGHAIIYHKARDRFTLRPIKENQTNSSKFRVLSGVKLYEVGGGTPPQTKEVAEAKPYSSTEPKPGWVPCLRTGDVHAFSYELGRLFVHYGEHLAHPKELARFQGPRLFLRRVPIWENRQLGAVFIEETALCAGDVLVVRHEDDDAELLKGLCVFLNSAEAADRLLDHRPSLRYRDSYPKFSAKDINAVLETGLPDEEALRAMARKYPGPNKPVDPVGEDRGDAGRLIDSEFPVGPVSAVCAKEKSVRHGHISTLQLWWARRPLAVCRAAVFASLLPDPTKLEVHSPSLKAINDALPGPGSPTDRVLKFIGELSEWKACSDEQTLGVARRLIAAFHPVPPKVVDTFAGGGSFPLEALRLGLDGYGSDLNSVAVTALKAALELLPGSPAKVVGDYRKVGKKLAERVKAGAANLYDHSEEEEVLAYFWARTYPCPKCEVEVPLLKNRLLASKGRKVIVTLELRGKRFEFNVVESPSAQEFRAAASGTVGAKGAVCPSCSRRVDTGWLQECSREGGMGDRLYAKRVKLANGECVYRPCGKREEERAASAALRPVSRRLKAVPAEPFDPNGIRHTWAMQYGIRTTADIFNNRQGIALLETWHEIDRTIQEFAKQGMGEDERRTLSVLLALTLNRLTMYNSRHAWWQPQGEFPANMFVRQAIPMVWNYVEIPVDSPGAGGIASAVQWLSMVAEHCRQLPRRGKAVQCDAAKTSLGDASVDLVTVDPPYYDSVVYAYLSDVFYVWMKPLLGSEFADLYRANVTSKAEEAIVDRPHKLAPAPKGDAHFRRKMKEAFQEAKRVLKPDGRLLVMFGHKKAKAWDAVMSPIFEAGFTPVASWPVHTERKAKLRHGHIAALSTSCLLVCVPRREEAKGIIAWAEFESGLRSALQPSLERNKANHLYGTDLVTATFAPAMVEFKRFARVVDNGKTVTIGEFLQRLPSVIADAQAEELLNDSRLGRYKKARTWLSELLEKHKGGQTEDPKGVFPSNAANTDELISNALAYSESLITGAPSAADELWKSLNPAEQTAMRVFFEAVALLSGDTSNLRQRADASLGRIGMRLREAM